MREETETHLEDKIGQYQHHGERAGVTSSFRREPAASVQHEGESLVPSLTARWQASTHDKG